jgi:hypothetical protein
MSTKSIAVVAHVPEDPVLLTAIGSVAICHGFLDHVLRRLVKTLADLTVEEADLALAREGSAVVRDMAKRIASRKFGREASATLKIRAYLTRCEVLTEKRNATIHDLYCRELDGDPLIIGRDASRPLPAATEVAQLAQDIMGLAHEINGERLCGFIQQAIIDTQGRKQVEAAKAESKAQ